MKYRVIFRNKKYYVQKMTGIIREKWEYLDTMGFVESIDSEHDDLDIPRAEFETQSLAEDFMVDVYCNPSRKVKDVALFTVVSTL